MTEGSGSPVKKRPGGRPPFVPTDEQKRSVLLHIACGATEAMIAKVLKIDEKTLRKHFSDEIVNGLVEANMRVAQSLFSMCVGRDAKYDEQGRLVRSEIKPAIGAICWWEKTRAGISEFGPSKKDVDDAKQAPLGKKELAAIAAENPDTNTSMGRLMAQREATKKLN